MGLKVIDFPDGYTSSSLPSTIPVTGMTTISKILNISEATAKAFDLPTVPFSPSTASLVYMGVPQTYGLDYIIDSRTVKFTSYRIESLIEVNDEFSVTYQ